MTDPRRARSRVVALALLSVAGAALAHYAIALGNSPTLGALLALVPLAFIAAVVTLRSRHRGLVLFALVAAAALVWAGWDALKDNFPGVFFLEHAGTNLLLGIMFGRTLIGASVPLVTRFARTVHGSLPPDVVAYTRRVTVAWTVFFLAVAALSSGLYLGGHLTAWSVFANFLTLPLIAGLFVAEYAVRLRALPDWERVSILEGIRAFWRHSRAASCEAPR